MDRLQEKAWTLYLQQTPRQNQVGFWDDLSSEVRSSFLKRAEEAIQEEVTVHARRIVEEQWPSQTEIAYIRKGMKFWRGATLIMILLFGGAVMTLVYLYQRGG